MIFFKNWILFLKIFITVSNLVSFTIISQKFHNNLQQ